MAAPMQRATQGFTAVAVAATLVTVGAGVYESRRPAEVTEVAAEGLQDLPRPFSPPPVPTPSPPATPVSETVLPTGLMLPSTVHRAYLNTESRLARAQPACRLDWAVPAGIGQVESGHARGGALDADGTTVDPIIGPALDGNGFAAIPDSDDGRLDADTQWDRAVGPMQFIPTTWAVWGADGNDDAVVNPHNMYDAALSAGRYLCAGDRDLSDPRQLRAALLSYNRSDTYADTVLAWIGRYRGTPPPAPAPSDSPTPGPSPSASVSRQPSVPSDGPSASSSSSRSSSPEPSDTREEGASPTLSASASASAERGDTDDVDD
ncbi:lytic transglycosylase domain-containing protein [Streptomyces sp. NPDC085932]|uniref:lytic transglycosylase domain-containing protein n=1 Tax=Streptomyces sp. NPDC085932 TaxID=3365741 RepID=UPI0037D3C689